jgi:transposase
VERQTRAGSRRPSWRLTAAQRQRLRAALARSDATREYRRMLAVLESDAGTPVDTIARSMGVSRRTVYHWLRVFRRAGTPGALREGARRGRPSRWSPQLRASLSAALRRTPDRLGYAAVEWTVPLLVEHLAARTGLRLSDKTVRRELQRRDYAWKRPRYVLAPDPAREKKALDPPQNFPASRALRAAAGGPVRG